MDETKLEQARRLPLEAIDKNIVNIQKVIEMKNDILEKINTTLPQDEERLALYIQVKGEKETE